jgi:transcriptional regulator with XRE-family HTH domain
MPKTDKATGAAVLARCDRRLLTRADAAEYLGVSPSTLSRWAADRTGPPFIKLNDGEAGAVRYPSDLLDAFVESRIKQPKE